MSTQTREREQSTDAGWKWQHINSALKRPAPGSLAIALCGARFRTRGRVFAKPLPDHCPLCVAVGTQQGRW